MEISRGWWRLRVLGWNNVLHFAWSFSIANLSLSCCVYVDKIIIFLFCWNLTFVEPLMMLPRVTLYITLSLQNNYEHFSFEMVSKPVLRKFVLHDNILRTVVAAPLLHAY